MGSPGRSIFSQLRLQNPLASLSTGLTEAESSEVDLREVEKQVGQLNFDLTTNLARVAIYVTLIVALPVLRLYRNDPGLTRSFLVWGGTLLVVCGGGLVLAQRHPHRIVPLFVTVMCIFFAVVGWSTSDLGGLDRPFVYAILMAPFASMLLAVPLVPRVAITFTIVGAYCLGIFLPHPEYLATPFLSAAVLNLLLSTFLSIAGGATVAQLVRNGFLQQQAALRGATRRRESDARYRELVESIDDVVAVFDQDGRCTYISPPVKRLVGYEPEELIGRTFADLVAKEDSAKVNEYIRRCREGQAGSGITELRIPHRSGGIRWVRSSAQPIYADGQFRGVRSTFGDITARVRRTTPPSGDAPSPTVDLATPTTIPSSVASPAMAAATRHDAQPEEPTTQPAPVDEAAALREEFYTESRQTIPSMLRIAVAVLIVAYCGFALEDWLTYRSLAPILLVEKLLTIAAWIGIARLSQSQWGTVNAGNLFVAFAWTWFASALFHAAQVGQSWAVCLATMALCTAVALQVPVRLSEQLACVAGALTAIFAGAFAIDGFFGPQATIALVVSGSSLVLAGLQERRRFAHWLSEKALRTSESRFRKLADHSSDIIWIWTTNQKVEYASPVYERFTGRPCQTLYDNPNSIAEVIHPDDRAEFADALTQIARGRFRKIDLRISHPDGTAYNMEGWGAPIHDEKGRVSLCVGIWHDVSERVRLVQELDAYARVVAHDLKNPIAVIRGFIEILGMKLEETIADDDRELIETSLRKCDAMTRIVNELLLLARVRSLDKIETLPLEMSAIVGAVQDRLSNMLSASGAQFNMPAHWPAAMGYPGWIEEVWSNYISNAIKYGGTPPLVEIGASEHGNGLVRFWVRDNGGGISEDDQARLFIEFSRVGPARADSHGLGLSIVKRIVEKLGGTVGVESVLGEGSTFWFTLPAAEVVAAADDSVSGPTSRSSQRESTA